VGGDVLGVQNRQSNYYQILGVQPEVTALEIKRAYRKIAKSHHPDVKFHQKTARQLDQDHEFMAKVNEAYETLIDKTRRADYDFTIGANGHSRSIRGKQPTGSSGDEERQAFLRHIFHPSRQSIVRMLAKYKQELADLSADIYDEELVATFEKYVDNLEQTLRKSANSLSSKEVPTSLRPAVQMMRYSIAQAADGLDELRRFCQNYDYNHLHMAANLFKESTDLSRKASQLIKA
jgi:molecular chaperone DnaJ